MEDSLYQKIHRFIEELKIALTAHMKRCKIHFLAITAISNIASTLQLKPVIAHNIGNGWLGGTDAHKMIDFDRASLRETIVDDLAIPNKLI